VASRRFVRWTSLLAAAALLFLASGLPSGAQADRATARVAPTDASGVGAGPAPALAPAPDRATTKASGDHAGSPLRADDPASLTGAPGDENWDAGFALPGPVSVLAGDGHGNLYAGGEFTTIGEVRANNIARWDGSRWSALGGGTNGGVSALAFDEAGNLYVGGYFTTAGSVTVNNIARWDGSTWSALGSGTNGGVSALAVAGDGWLYVGGGFTTAGEAGANGIALWNGYRWSSVGSALGYGGMVSALAVDGAGNLYAGGWFSKMGGVSANFVAKWDGSAWSALGSGVAGHVFALVVDGAGNLYAGGGFPTAGGMSADNIAKWDGSTWSALESGLTGCNYACVSALVIDGLGNLYAGGQFTVAGGVSAAHVAKWDGSTWSALGRGMNAGVSTLAADGLGNLYAGGGYKPSYIGRWDGLTWNPLPPENGMNAAVRALAMDRDGGLYVGGEFGTAGGVSANHVVKWDGSTWNALGSGIDGTVYALAADGLGNLYAGGWFNVAGGVRANNIAKWDGGAWSSLGTASNYYNGTNDAVHALAVDGAGKLYAGGDFTQTTHGSANHIARWDGDWWWPLGSGLRDCGYDCVSALAVDGRGNLYAGGWFDIAGEVSASHIARWDGRAWSVLGSGMNGEVMALALDRAGNLYAGGGFTLAGGVLANYIAKWDGSRWSALGSAVGGGISALAVDGIGNVYAGGYFTSAGGKPSYYFARWTAAVVECGLSAGGSHTLYAGNLPVTVNVSVPGTLECIAVQRFNKSHPDAGKSLQTGYYWEIAGMDSNGAPAAGFTVDLTLPTTFIAGATHALCRYAGIGWDCAATSYTTSSVTRAGLTELSDWTVGREANPGSIGGVAWFDVDGDGGRDEGEPGLAGVQITLFRDGAQIERVVTLGDGSYSLPPLSSGEYLVRETQPAWLRYSSTPDDVPVTLAAGQHATVDFGDWAGIPLWLPMMLVNH
jgi:hypothetical protein